MEARSSRLPLAILVAVVAAGTATVLLRPRSNVIEPTSVDVEAYFSPAQIDRAEEDYFDDSEYEEATDDAVDAASLLFREPSPEELELLRRMKDWAINASTRSCLDSA